MSKRLDYNRPGHRADQLTTELYQRFPEWVEDRDGERHARASVASDGSTLVLVVPDDADEGAIVAVLDAHRPAARPTAPRAPTVEERQLLRDFLTGTNFTTLAQANMVVRALMIAVRHRLGELG